MLKLPANTKLNKQLPKKAIYTKFNLKTTARSRFDTDISKITIINEITPTTTNIAKGENIESFFVLLVSLKHKAFNEKNIAMLSKLIAQHMLFVLECGDLAKLAVYHGNLIQTDWLVINNLSIQLTGLNFDTVWENIIIQVGGIQVENGNTLDEQLLIDKQHQQLEKQLTSLERQARAEKQPRRKYELVQEMNRLKKSCS